MTVTTEPRSRLSGDLLPVLASGSTTDADLVAWASEHLVALEQVVYPVARRVLPDRDALADQQSRTHHLEHALRRLHQRVSGDGGAMHLPVAGLRNDVRERLAAHDTGERQLEEQLREALGTDAWDGLAARYRRAADAAPTRPHPHAPRSGWSGRLAQGVLAQLDQLLDVLDARPVADAPRGA